MHPNPAFRPDEAGLLDRAAGFAHLFVATPVGPLVAHAPLTRHGEELWLHLARANRLFPHLAGATVLASVAGPDGYLTPNWFARADDQVPTWNYTAIEIEGMVRPLSRDDLLTQLDTLAERHEPNPNPWTRAKTDPAKIDAMLRAIGGFAITVTGLRGTDKLAQHKSAADRAGMIAGLRALADAMERA
ncbi:MAG: hypothetical protein JWN21_890 [Sphingomonas bacterium]|uniref:FMN-binding negative transcriptional regulator n=1 Tax=Sphingomonas bacterium TaxID=1895847 RepID=UPI00262D4395|nr:FMN-binding negative transcriptional regulator [Sphingomonas bacterium]MDB5695347.1 hypothetical protein [Sphingomonas bacterium]